MKFSEKDIVLGIIKKKLEQYNINIIRVLLFGSRARGDFSKFSDWDFFVIIDTECSFKEKVKIITEIKKELAEERIPNDIILKAEQDFNNDKNYVGNISYYVNMEGREVA